MQPLESRFRDALGYAAEIHAGQVRKGSDVPYVAHLLAVCAIALEHGADEDEAVAALLHDAGEDQGGRERLAEVRERFGDRVAEIVAACSDTFETPKPPWSERKESYLDHLDEVEDPGIVLVSASDKLHNVRSTLSDHRARGDAIWAKFRTGSKADQQWYHAGLLDRYRKACDRLDAPAGVRQLVGEYARAVEELESL